MYAVFNPFPKNDYFNGLEKSEKKLDYTPNSTLYTQNNNKVSQRYGVNQTL